MVKKLYHDKKNNKEKPIYGYGKKYNDYGLGFYCTEDFEMAKEWAARKDNDGFVNIYEFETNNIKILHLNSKKYTTLHWLTILLQNRTFDITTPLAYEAKEYLIKNFSIDKEKYDVIIGYRADDSYFSFAQDFINGSISYRQLSNSMRLGKLGEQFVLISKKAFDNITFKDSYIVSNKEQYYEKRMARDQKARKNMGCMLDYAINTLGYSLSSFFDLFLKSSICLRFETGDFSVIAGMSGIENAYAVLDEHKIEYERIIPNMTISKSEEYWVGWAIAYYQWETSTSYSDIIKCVSIDDIRLMYNPYHELDIKQFVSTMNEKTNRNLNIPNLKKMRQKLGYSQKQLADISKVPLRTIQQYEQRQKNINKAQVESLVLLSQALFCSIYDILE